MTGTWYEQQMQGHVAPAPATMSRRITVDGVEATTAGESSWTAPPGYSRVSADAITRAAEQKLNLRDPVGTAEWDTRADARAASWATSLFAGAFQRLFSWT